LAIFVRPSVATSLCSLVRVVSRARGRLRESIVITFCAAVAGLCLYYRIRWPRGTLPVCVRHLIRLCILCSPFCVLCSQHLLLRSPLNRLLRSAFAAACASAFCVRGCMRFCVLCSRVHALLRLLLRFVHVFICSPAYCVRG
jgi:hypothetical protein